MSMGIAAAVVGSVVTNVVSGFIRGDASSEAANVLSESSQYGIDEQRRQFDAMREILKPYITAGYQSINDLGPFQQAGAQASQQQQAISGLLGLRKQRQAINEIRNSPLFKSEMRQGEEAMLQNASATGGLRGGNLQAALAQYRPQLLQRAITDQYDRLGGFSDNAQKIMGMLYAGGGNAALAQVEGGMNMASNIGNLLDQQGSYRASGEIERGEQWNTIPSGINKLLGINYGMRGPGGGLGGGAGGGLGGGAGGGLGGGAGGGFGGNWRGYGGLDWGVGPEKIFGP